MSWSTRELAELAGTTVNTVRHYHQLGLLDEPERLSNGYKQYGVPHLLTLLRIRRLVDLGVPLSRVADMVTTSDMSTETLHEIDDELQAGIARLTKARERIAAILRERAAPDIPAGFETVAARMSEADTQLIGVMSRFYDEEAMANLAEMMNQSDDALSAEVDALPADADEATIDSLATRYAPVIARDFIAHPWMRKPVARAQASTPTEYEAIAYSIVELYNPAQLEVFVRANRLAHRLADAAEAAASADGSEAGGESLDEAEGGGGAERGDGDQ